MANEFRYSGLMGRVAHSDADYMRMQIDHFPNRIECLKSIRERLVLLDEPNQPATGLSRNQTAFGTQHDVTSDNEAFVVHGHDLAILHEVCRFLENLELKPIVLIEQANEGQHMMEKLEKHSNVRFAVVLLTGDDKGGAEKAEKFYPRARQNVILELGYFVGKLGRKNVCPLYETGVELPSDYHGVGFVPLDGGIWKLKLAAEMKAAGLNFDMNKAI